jgi:hypothetical protein
MASLTDTGEDFDLDSWFSQKVAAGAERDKEEASQAAVVKGGAQNEATDVSKWVMNLPKNISVGLFDAAVNTIRGVGDLAGAMDSGAKAQNREARMADPNGLIGGDPNAGLEGKTPQQLREKYLAEGRPAPQPLPGSEGMVEPGNLNLYTRPRVKLPGGGTATVRSMGANIDGQEVLLPTISKDGRALSHDEAIAEYRRTGEHLGKFNSVDSSNAYAQALHEQQAQLMAKDAADLHGKVSDAVMSFRDFLAQGSDTPDQITQGIAQFALPMLGWSKLLGGLRGASTLGTIARTAAAESATVATVADPQGMRAADLVQMGKSVEGKLGDSLNAIAPDGSALNAYIDYMTDRSDEGAVEGRFKNVIDNLGLSAAAGAVLKTGATTIKFAHGLPEYIAENAGRSRVGRSAQEGHIVFHGTPHDFEAFDSSKIGSGEGNSTFGHGLYFAESKDTASHYHRALARRGVQPGSAMENALSFVQAANGDERAAYESLMRAAEKSGNPEYAARLRQSADIVKAGNAKPRGSVMEVHIPDEKVAQMLDHDAHMNEQPQILEKIPPKDKEAFEELLDEHNFDPDLETLRGSQFYQLIGNAISEDRINFDPPSGRYDSYKQLASEYLHSKGIPGIRYFDQSSRKSGEGTRNIVLFDAKDAQILKKNGKPVEPKKSGPKFEIVPGTNGFALSINGKQSLAFHTIDEAEQVIKELGGTPPARPSEDVIKTTEQKLKSAPAVKLPALENTGA